MILTADLHLDDNPKNAYRWKVFNAIENAIAEHGDTDIYILGDICDRKDRHAAGLVNPLIEELERLVVLGASFTIIMGNHDKPLTGPPFWRFLTYHTGITFHEQPTVRNVSGGGRLLLLPYASNPAEEWADLPMADYDAIFMHQTVTGVREKGFTATNNKMPVMPNIPIYSGDIHTPQKVGPVTYVGAPHPVKFGDDYPCRMLVLDKAFRLKGQIDLYPPRKSIVSVASLEELERVKVSIGDQVQINWQLPVGEMDRWAVTEEAVAQWSKRQGVVLDALEPTIQLQEGSEAEELAEDPRAILEAFADAEGLAGDLRNYGFELMERARGR